MLGDAWGRAGYLGRRVSGFSPSVDVYYCGDPQRAVIKVDLGGVVIDHPVHPIEVAEAYGAIDAARSGRSYTR